MQELYDDYEKEQLEEDRQKLRESGVDWDKLREEYIEDRNKRRKLFKEDYQLNNDELYIIYDIFEWLKGR